MKLFILVTIISIQVSASALAQQITLNVKNASLNEVMSAVRKQSGYNFIVSSDNTKNAKLVTVNLKDATIENALQAIFVDQPLNYQINGKIIILTPKDQTTTNPSILDNVKKSLTDVIITGRVTDEKGNGISGVSVRIKGKTNGTVTDANGHYTIKAEEKNVIIFSYVGYTSQEVKIIDNTQINILLKESSEKLREITVVSNGYQDLPKERSTGSFVKIDNELLNRRVGTNILDRLDGVTSGLIFNGTKSTSSLVQSSSGSLGINIRGESTLSNDVSRDPLIVLDNFPYEGSIENINPNDIESISVLKDAAAASIWGARSGNGVIVITTKKGRFNSKPQVDFNTNFTVGNKPDLYYDKKFLNSNTYIDIEKDLFSKGYYDIDLGNTYNYPALSPVVGILASSLSQNEKDQQINALRNIDVRDDYNKYVYQKSINQQYSLSMHGGGKSIAYTISVGYDKNRDNLVRNGLERFTINSQNIYNPIQNLEISTTINYSNSKSLLNNTFSLGNILVNGNTYNQLYPYARLADGQGNALSIVRDHGTDFINSTVAAGYLDWNYRPLDEINNADNSIKTNDLLAKISLKYQFNQYFNLEALYQNEVQKVESRNYYNENTYTTRNLINGYSQYDPDTKTFTYPFPRGSILNLGNYNRFSNNGRLQLNYRQTFNTLHNFNGILGSEIRQIRTENYLRNSYGYDDEYGTSASALNYAQFYPIYPGGFGRLPGAPGSINGTVNRYISYYTNLGYTYDNRYTITLSGRRDGANIFGVKTNDKITPLWSAGLGWMLSNENFYKNNWLPYLKLRASYGYNGNVYNGSAYVTGRFATSPLTNAQIITDLLAPNPQLRWEKVRNINIGIDFASKNNRISGSIEPYQKSGRDLINTIPVTPSTGFSTFNGNSARTKTNGIDLQLNTINIDGNFKWKSYILLSSIKDKVVEYNVTQTNTSIQTSYGVALVDKPLYSIFSYKWAGLDPNTGNPQGYLNGKVSQDYTSIINNFSPDSLVFNGSARPTLFGSVRNEFSYQNFSLSVNIVYKGGHYFRRPSTSLNEASIISSSGYSDVANRWLKPGDEKSTNVPSLSYPSDDNRNNFYQYSEVLIEKADHIRLQDIRISYTLSDEYLKRLKIRNLTFFTYVNNVGIIWRANKYKIDPDVIGSNNSYALPNPRSFAFGLNMGL